MNYKKVCLICNKEFTTYNKTKVICSTSCRLIANRLYAKQFMKRKRAIANIEVIKPCVLCHEEFKSYEVQHKVICLSCELAKREVKIDLTKYDNTFKDNEDIIYGTISKPII